MFITLSMIRLLALTRSLSLALACSSSGVMAVWGASLQTVTREGVITGFWCALGVLYMCLGLAVVVVVRSSEFQDPFHYRVVEFSLKMVWIFK